MDKKEQRLTFKLVEWSKRAADLLENAVPYITVHDLELQVINGASLFEISEDSGLIVGYYVLRIDYGPRGGEGVIVAAAGSIPGVDLVALTLPTIEKQFNGCYSIRIHTARAGLVRKLLHQGYGAAEIVLRKKFA